MTLDDLVHYDARTTGLPIPPKGRHMFGLVRLGERGQIVIPKKAREVFCLTPGDELLVLGDETQGIAIVKAQDFLAMTSLLRDTMREVDSDSAPTRPTSTKRE